VRAPAAPARRAAAQARRGGSASGEALRQLAPAAAAFERAPARVAWAKHVPGTQLTGQAGS